MIQQDFEANVLPAGWTEDKIGAATITYAGGQVTLVSNATDRATLLSPVEAMNTNGDSQLIFVNSRGAFNTFVALKMGGDATTFRPCIYPGGANLITGIYRPATGTSPLTSGSTTFDPGAPFWVRFQRVSATVLNIDTAPDVAGVPGAFTTRGVVDDTIEPTEFDYSIAQIELVAFPDGATLVVNRVGDGVVAVPAVTSYAPSSGPIGTSITGTGTNLTGSTGATMPAGVSIASLTSFVVVNATTFTAVIPAGATTGAITVQNPGGNAVGPTFTVYVPVFTSLGVVDPNTIYAVGTLLNPITVTKRDQMGIATTLGPTTVTAAEILPSRSVSGTLTQTFSGAVATFNDLVIIADGGPPPPEDIIIFPSKKTVYSVSPTAAQETGVAFTTAITGTVTNKAGVVDTAFVTPVNLIVKRGAARLVGTTTVTPVAGAFTFPQGTVSARLDNTVAKTVLQVGIAGIEGVTLAFDVNVAAPAAVTLIDQQNVPSGSVRAIVQLTGTIAGGNVQFQGTVNMVDWFLVDLIPFVAGASANTFTTAFAGYADVSGLEAVRLIKSVTSVTFGTATLVVEDNV